MARDSELVSTRPTAATGSAMDATVATARVTARVAYNALIRVALAGLSATSTSPRTPRAPRCTPRARARPRARPFFGEGSSGGLASPARSPRYSLDFFSVVLILLFKLATGGSWNLQKVPRTRRGPTYQIEKNGGARCRKIFPRGGETVSRGEWGRGGGGEPKTESIGICAALTAPPIGGRNRIRAAPPHHPFRNGSYGAHKTS